MVQVKEHPILFSGEMVRAILEGRKTQTRRVVKPQPSEITVRTFDEGRCAEVIWADARHMENRGGGTRDGGRDILQGMVYERNPYGQPGDLLWVKETWQYFWPSHSDKQLCRYRADELDGEAGPWRPSIFMPRWASRLTLEVVSVRVERVNAISEADAIAEGMQVAPGHMYRAFDDPGPMKPYTHRQAFGALWDEINGKRAPWASNPWVWVVTFKRVTA